MGGDLANQIMDTQTKKSEEVSELDNWQAGREKKRLSGQEEVEAESLRVKTPAAAAPAARALRAEETPSESS